MYKHLCDIKCLRRTNWKKEECLRWELDSNAHSRSCFHGVVVPILLTSVLLGSASGSASCNIREFLGCSVYSCFLMEYQGQLAQTVGLGQVRHPLELWIIGSSPIISILKIFFLVETNIRCTEHEVCIEENFSSFNQSLIAITLSHIQVKQEKIKNDGYYYISRV